MQRYTVKISYEEGRKLGLVLVDTPIPEEVETYESDEEEQSYNYCSEHLDCDWPEDSEEDSVHDDED